MGKRTKKQSNIEAARAKWEQAKEDERVAFEAHQKGETKPAHTLAGHIQRLELEIAMLKTKHAAEVLQRQYAHALDVDESQAWLAETARLAREELDRGAELRRQGNELKDSARGRVATARARWEAMAVERQAKGLPPPLSFPSPPPLPPPGRWTDPTMAEVLSAMEAQNAPSLPCMSDRVKGLEIDLRDMKIRAEKEQREADAAAARREDRERLERESKAAAEKALAKAQREQREQREAEQDELVASYDARQDHRPPLAPPDGTPTTVERIPG